MGADRLEALRRRDPAFYDEVLAELRRRGLLREGPAAGTGVVPERLTPYMSYWRESSQRRRAVYSVESDHEQHKTGRSRKIGYVIGVDGYGAKRRWVPSSTPDPATLTAWAYATRDEAAAALWADFQAQQEASSGR